MRVDIVKEWQFMPINLAILSFDANPRQTETGQRTILLDQDFAVIPFLQPRRLEDANT